MSSDVEEIKKKIDIVDFIGQYVAFKKSGRNLKALCPFHNEKTPSFMVSADRQIWRCFGACQDGGDVIHFLMKLENITFYEALTELAKKAGVRLTSSDFEDANWKKKERLYSINALAQEFYHFILKKHKLGKSGQEYLKNRGIEAKIIDTFKLGVSPASWDSLLKFLKKRGYKDEEMVTAGLIIRTDKGRLYDRFRQRLMFPLKDPRGNTIGFSGRLLGEAQEAKYVNTPETPVYHKRETLFGINIVKDMIKEKDRVLLVEGEFDMLSCFKMGISNVVAIKGSAVTREQLMLIKRYTKRITLALDSDFSGLETTKRAISDAEELDFEVSVAAYDFAKDPDEALQKDAVAFKKIVAKPTPLYDFLIDQAYKNHPDDDAYSKKNIAEDVIDHITLIQNPVVKAHYLNKVSDLLQIDTRALLMLERKHTNKKRPQVLPAPASKTQEIGHYELLQRYTLSHLFQSKTSEKLYHKVFEIVAMEDFSIPSHQKLLTFFERYLATKPDEKNWPRAFVTTLPAELVRVFDELYLFDIAIFEESTEEFQFSRVLYELKKCALKWQIKQLLPNVEDDATSNKVTLLTHNLSEVEKKLSVL